MPQTRIWRLDQGHNRLPLPLMEFRAGSTLHPFKSEPDILRNTAAQPADSAGSSQALSNLRALVILVVVAFHSALAYLGSLDPSPLKFDESPFKWRAFPIIDSHRWYGFDIFCAWQDVYLMGFMFFLSALFTWPSISRKGSATFLADRFLRLGLPFVFAVTVVVPLALYPAYRLTANDPGVIAYAHHYLALPFLPNGPMWFLWELLALTVVAAGLHRAVPQWIESLGRKSMAAGTNPGRYYAGLVAAAVMAYVPLALAFTPWNWSMSGPLSFQFSRPLLYAVLYIAGLGVGAFGLGRGLLAPGGTLAARWSLWLAVALGSFTLWMALTALGMRYRDGAPLELQLVTNACFAWACVSGCFCAMAGCLRFGAVRSPILESLANSAFGIYLLHYVFVVWLQYAFLGLAVFALAKGLFVFSASLVLAWASVALMRQIPFCSALIGEARQPKRKAASLSTGDRNHQRIPPPKLARQ